MNELKESYSLYRKNGFVMHKSAKLKKHAYREGAYIDRKNESYSDDATGYVAIIPSNLIIVDNDKYQDEGASFAKLLDDLGLEEYEVTPFALTPSGGEHYAFENPNPDMVIGNVGKDYPALDIYAGYQSVLPIVGTQVTNKQGELATYKWGTTEKFVVNPYEPSMMELFKMRVRTDAKANPYDEDDFGLAVAIKADEMPQSEVDELLERLPDNLDYDTWLAIGMCIFDRYEGSDEGYKVFNEFSLRSEEKYSEALTMQKWNSGTLKPTRTSYKTLRSIVNELVIQSFEEQIKTKKGKELVEIISEISKIPRLNTRGSMDGKSRMDLAQKINTRMKETKDETGVKVLQARTIENDITYVPDEKEVKEETKAQSSWLDDVVYVESVSRTPYIVLSTGERLSSKGMGGRYASQLQELKKVVAPKSKSILTMDNVLARGLLTVCSDHEYNPQNEDNVFKRKGVVTYNLYKGNRPPVAKEYTVEGKELVDKFVAHISNIMSDEEAEVLLNWLAWTAQNFGKKVLWTPLIQSAEGLGKSIIGNVMINNVFGKSNSGTVDSNVVVSPQTSWATNGVFRVLEEIKLAGHNRYEVINQLKPFITNDTVSRVEKYEASSEVRNFTNFIAFTNFTDAIPVSGDDRRWWVVFSKLSSIEALEKEVGMHRNEYFEPLHELAQAGAKYGSEFHKFMLDRDVSKFNPNFPPMSLHKDRMRATEDSKTPHLTEMIQLLSTPSKGVTDKVVSTRQLKKIMMSERWDGNTLNDGDVTVLLRKLGYIKFPKQIKSEGNPHNVWFKEAGMKDTKVRSEFHESMKLDIEDGFDDLDTEEF